MCDPRKQTEVLSETQEVQLKRDQTGLVRKVHWVTTKQGVAMGEVTCQTPPESTFVSDCSLQERCRQECWLRLTFLGQLAV